MINITPNCSRHKQAGVATLIISTVLLVTATLIVLFAASYSVMSQKITANQYRYNQAFEAAEAGLEFGIPYLQQNRATIVANPSGGHIQAYSNSNTNNVSLSNSSTYTIGYTNPVANNYNLLLVTSTGTSDDGTSTHVVSQLVEYGSLIFAPPQTALISKGAISVTGNSSFTNTHNNNTIVSGSSLTMGGNSETILSTGVSSTPGHLKSDVTQNNATLANLSQADFFATYFGDSISTVKSNVVHYYQNSNSTNYTSTLNGMNGTSIWIDQNSGTATINGNATIGTTANPVLLIINGDFDISGNVTINGFVFVLGASSVSTDITGNVTINGGLVASDNINASGNISINYSPSTETNLQTQTPITFFAKVPGSWKDF